MTMQDDSFAGIPGHVAQHAATRPGDVAFQVEGRRQTWHALATHLAQVARALAAEGVAPGDRVALLGAASLAYVECLFGAIAARACAVPLPVSASEAALDAMLADSGARVLFLDPDSGPAAAQVAARAAAAGVRVIPFGEGGTDGTAYTRWRDAPGAGVLRTPQPGDAFNIIYSSGTTGMPKGIVHLHGMRERQASRKGFDFSPASRTLLSTPMYSNTTITPLLGTVVHGGRCILMRKFDAGGFLDLAAAEGVTHTMLVPVQYQRILAHPRFATQALATLQASQSTGAPMDVALKRDILERWPGRFVEVYGLTEGGVSCFLEPRLHPGKLHTVGKPGHGTEVFLLDEQGQRLPDTPGLTGEVAGRSPFMMAGYHRRPDADAEIRWHDALGERYHRTGDIGRFDADGFLTLLDRKKDVIISGGNNVYAADLESVLGRHPGVRDAAVIGVPSPQWGETPLALVVPRDGVAVDAQTLREWVNGQVGKTQRLAAVELREALPRNALGKLSKKELRAPYWRAAQEGVTPP